MVLERSGESRRRYIRYSVDWGASLTTPSNQIYHGRIYNLSLGGALIHADKHIVTDGPLTIAIKTPLLLGGLKNYVPRIECGISHDGHSPERHMYQVRLKFLNLDGIEKHLLAEALFKQFEQSDRRTLN